jgi:hypothetical protein
MAKPVVVEILDGHGRARHRERLLLDPANLRFTVGRGVAADVILDDPHVAVLHAEVEVTEDGRVLVSDLGSRNGVMVGERRLRGAQSVAIDEGLFGVGHTRLRVRTEAEKLAPERVENGVTGGMKRNEPWLALGGAIICFAFAIYNAWLAAPQDIASAIATTFIGSAMMAGAWIAAWGFVTRVVRGEWRWSGHAAIFFATLAVIIVVDFVFDIVWFSLSLPPWNLREAILLAAGVVLALYCHMRYAANVGVRRAATVALLLPLVVGGGSYLVLARDQARNVNYIEVDAKLFPPAWRLRSGGDLNAYFDEVMRLQEETDRKRRAMVGEEGEEP